MTFCPSGIYGYCLKSCSTEHGRGGTNPYHCERQIQKPLMQYPCQMSGQ